MGKGRRKKKVLKIGKLPPMPKFPEHKGKLGEGAKPIKKKK